MKGSRLDARLDVVIVYDDDSAGQHAIHTLDVVTRHLGDGIKVHPLLWRFDHLEDPEWRAAATGAAVETCLVILSTSSKNELSAAVRDWIHGCLRSETGAPGAMVALLGPADDMDKPDSPRFRFLKDMAEAAGRSFFSPSAPAETSTGARTESNPVASRPMQAPNPSSGKILLVEDDSSIRQLNVKVLMRAGYQVDSVAGSQAGWESLQIANYDLLITDNQMPGLTGAELVRKLRDAQMTMPVIFASGGLGAEELERSQWLQPAAVLPKPFTSDALLQMVARILGRAGPAPVPYESYFHWGLND